MRTPDTPESATAVPPLKPAAEAWVLGVAGLLPFVAGAVGLWALPSEWAGLAALALLTYAAVIVSFWVAFIGDWRCRWRRPKSAAIY